MRPTTFRGTSRGPGQAGRRRPRAREDARRARQFVRDAFSQLKAIAVDKGGRALLKAANVNHDPGVVDTNDKDAFIAAAKTRQWEREKTVRTLA